VLGTLVYRYKYMYVTKHTSLITGTKRVEYWVYNKVTGCRVKLHGGGAYTQCKQLCKLVADNRELIDDKWLLDLCKKLRGDENVGDAQ